MPTCPSTVRLYVTVVDTVAVQRVLTMLTGRSYALTHFEAEEAGAGRWRLSIDATIAPDDVEVLELRLHRIPSVLAVSVRAGSSLAATA